MLDISPSTVPDETPRETAVVRELITFHGSVTKFPQFAVRGFLRVVDRHEDGDLTAFTVERWAA